MRFAVKVQSRPTALLDPPAKCVATSEEDMGTLKVEDWLGAARRIPGCQKGAGAPCIKRVKEDCGRGVGVNRCNGQ